MKYIKSIILLLALLILSACSEKELDESRIDTSTPALSELDVWLRDTYVTPYNVEVLYKWVDYETDMTKNLVPPEEDKVKPLMEVMDKVWVKCYEEEAGATFIKSFIPKMIYLLGGAGVNPEGTVTQGTAEAGRKIVLYEVNKFDPNDRDGINRFFHVMHHEFAHILHQTELYQTETYESISVGMYRTDWYNISEDDVESYLGEGFVSPYSMSSRDEDFVEVIAYMLTRTKEEWEAYITQEGANEEKLRAKEAIVNDYFMTVWDIDIFALQALIAESIVAITADGEEVDIAAYTSPVYYRSGAHAELCSNCKVDHE